MGDVELIFAVDFDGTLVKNKFPDVGNPNTTLINFCKSRQSDYNDKIILWTCRTDEHLKDALDYLKNNFDFIPDYVNENAPWDKNIFPNESRKIGADYYIDDRAININNLDEFIKTFNDEDKMKNNVEVNKDEIIQQLCKAICPIIQPHTCFNLCKNVGNCQELREKVTKIYDIFCLGDIDMKDKLLNKGLYVDYNNPFTDNKNVGAATTSNKIEGTDTALGVDAWGPYIGKCPKCGSANIEANYGLVLTSYPPQYNCRCKDCSHVFFSGQINQENESDNAKPAFPKDPGWVPYNPDPNPVNPGYGYGNRQGWICPRCGKVNSPDRDFCDCSGIGWIGVDLANSEPTPHRRKICEGNCEECIFAMQAKDFYLKESDSTYDVKSDYNEFIENCRKENGVNKIL